jgi:hypothetical protein
MGGEFPERGGGREGGGGRERAEPAKGGHGIRVCHGLLLPEMGDTKSDARTQHTHNTRARGYLGIDRARKIVPRHEGIALAPFECSKRPPHEALRTITGQSGFRI